jgi:hypothetical protein
MIPVKPAAGSPQHRKLLEPFEKLNATDQQSVIAFAQFLASRETDAANLKPVVPDQPEGIERPMSESVIGAVRRLSKNYPMIEKSILLHHTSELVSSHIMQGRPAEEVIDELEALFARHYAQYLENFDVKD